jgi:hypothetical protein
MLSEAERKRKRNQAAKIAAENQVCDECGKLIENCRLYQHLHDGDCTTKYRNKTGRTGKIYRNPEKKHRCFCNECKEYFMSSRPTSKICRSIKCKNDAQRKKAKLTYDALTEEQKKTWRKKKYRSDKPSRAVYKKTKFKIIAKCPRCEEDHEIIVYAMDPPKVKPRVFCTICKKTVEAVGDNAYRYRASFPAMQEYHAI